ncbi:MAG: WYL domain-containing protein [Bacteroidales bacterium]|nr:WYL domain-containing protein [Bacteroidales bacterium]
MSDQPKIERILKLIIFLSTGTGHTIKEIAEAIEISERTAFRYLDTLNHAGFFVERNHEYYQLRYNERGKALSDLLHFSKEEAHLLAQAINSLEGDSVVLTNLREKLYSLYKTVPYTAAEVNLQHSNVIQQLSEAIQQKKQVVLVKYRSSSSQFIRDRLVEPFRFTTNFTDVWCFEPESQQNKVFKTSRIEEVKLYDRTWQYEEKHCEGKPDPFRMHTPNRYPVKLRMSLLAYNLLCEEYPMAKEYVTKVNDNEYIFETEVCSYAGVGRFVLGLMDEIEVLETKEFKDYLYGKIFKKKF